MILYCILSPHPVFLRDFFSAREKRTVSARAGKRAAAQRAAERAAVWNRFMGLFLGICLSAFGRDPLNENGLFLDVSFSQARRNGLVRKHGRGTRNMRVLLASCRPYELSYDSREATAMQKAEIG